MTIKSKLLSTSMIGLIIITVILGFISIQSSKDSLIKSKYNSLMSVNKSKKNQIEKLFKDSITNINVLANTPNVQDLSTAFRFIISRLGIKDTDDFPYKHTLVQNRTLPFADFFKSYDDKYGYENVLIIDTKFSRVIYSQKENVFYGANLVYGKLKDSSLAIVYKEVLKTKKATYIDMQLYKENNNKTSMFLAAPVLIDDELVSVLVLEISNDSINNIMSFRQGYDKSQEDYLVGKDKLMRSVKYLNKSQYNLSNSFKKNLKLNTLSINEAIKGKSDTKIIKDFENIDVLSAYSPIKITKSITWAIISEIHQKEVLIEPNKLQNKIILVSLMLLIIVSIVTYILIIKNVVKPLNAFQNNIVEFFKYLNKESNEINILDDTANDEIGIMVKVVNENIKKTKLLIEQDEMIIKNVKEIVSSVKDGKLDNVIEGSTKNESLEELKVIFNEMLLIMSTKVCKDVNSLDKLLNQYKNLNFMTRIDDVGKTAVAVNSLADTITKMLLKSKSNGLSLQNNSNILLENVYNLDESSVQTSTSISETTSSLKEITLNINTNNETVAKMSTHGNELKTLVNEGQNLASETTEAMDLINNEVDEISSAISVIDQIAFQTNILSLNAAVEAATAGEAGKGFAVVAQEVRNLATRSADAANEIKALVETAATRANEGKKIADKMIDGYSNLNESIENTLNLITSVKLSSTKQQESIVLINESINTLETQTKNNAEIAKNTKKIAINTQEIADSIVEVVNEKEFIGK